MESDEQPWFEYRFRAMGSQITLWLDVIEADEAQRAFAQIEALFATNETALSRFRPQSELSGLNGRPGEWVPVSALLWDVLTTALALADLTDGLFDPTLLNALEAAGYSQSFSERPWSVAAPSSPPADVGRWTAVRLDPERRAVYLPPGVRLDFGGIGKGMTAQTAVEVLSAWGPCLVDAGGDVSAGDSPPHWPGWPVAISRPMSDATATPPDLLTVWLANATLATSGIDYRRWQHNDRPAHHLIDPRTGRPAETDLLTATVLLANAGQAEAVATAVLIMGAAAGYDWLARHHVPAVLSDANGDLLLTPGLAPAAKSIGQDRTNFSRRKSSQSLEIGPIS